MTSDPTEALDALSRLRALTHAIAVCRDAEVTAHFNWVEARRKLREAIANRDRAIEGELAELPLFDEAAPESEPEPAVSPTRGRKAGKGVTA